MRDLIEKRFVLLPYPKKCRPQDFYGHANSNQYSDLAKKVCFYIYAHFLSLKANTSLNEKGENF